VARDQHAVFRDDDVGLDHIGAHRDRKCIGFERLFGDVARGAAVRNHDRGLALQGLERGRRRCVVVATAASGERESDRERQRKAAEAIDVEFGHKYSESRQSGRL